MRKASSMIITKAPESETNDENTQPRVCFKFFKLLSLLHFSFTILA